VYIHGSCRKIKTGISFFERRYILLPKTIASFCMYTYSTRYELY